MDLAPSRGAFQRLDSGVAPRGGTPIPDPLRPRLARGDRRPEPFARIAAVAKLREYESDVSRMLRELLEQHPELIEAQRAGRSMWWDRTLDAEFERAIRAATVPQKPYVYDCDATVRSTINRPSR